MDFRLENAQKNIIIYYPIMQDGITYKLYLEIVMMDVRGGI